MKIYFIELQTYKNEIRIALFDDVKFKLHKVRLFVLHQKYLPDF